MQQSQRTEVNQLARSPGRAPSFIKRSPASQVKLSGVLEGMPPACPARCSQAPRATSKWAAGRSLRDPASEPAMSQKPGNLFGTHSPLQKLGTKGKHSGPAWEEFTVPLLCPQMEMEQLWGTEGDGV